MMHNQNRTKRKGIDLSSSKPLTEQSHAAGCDIKNILNRASKTGVLPNYGGTFENLPNVPSFHEAQSLLASASQAFDSLPLEIRSKMNHSPVEFLEFITNTENREKMLEMGLSDAHLPSRPEAPPITSTEKPASAEPIPPEPTE